jgi:hypothetical protein
MILTKRFKNSEQIKQGIEEWLNGEHVSTNQRSYLVGDGYTDSLARCWETDNGYDIETALSGFCYEIEFLDSEVRVTYDGAYNGLGQQEILPEVLKTLDWSEGKVESTFGYFWWEEYQELRKEQRDITIKLHELYGDKGYGVLDGIEATPAQIQSVFDGYDNWDWDIEKEEGDPINRRGDKNSDDYNWYLLTFEFVKPSVTVVTPFTIWVRERKAA